MKKGLLALASSILLSLPMQAMATTEVTWWDFLGGGDGVRMKSLIDQFNTSQSDVKINASTLEWGFLSTPKSKHRLRWESNQTL